MMVKDVMIMTIIVTFFCKLLLFYIDKMLLICMNVIVTAMVLKPSLVVMRGGNLRIWKIMSLGKVVFLL